MFELLDKLSSWHRVITSEYEIYASTQDFGTLVQGLNLMCLHVDKFTFLTTMFELLDKLISGFIIKGTKNADCSMFSLIRNTGNSDC